MSPGGPPTGIRRPDPGEGEVRRLPFQVIPRELAFFDLLRCAAPPSREATGDLLALMITCPSGPDARQRIRDLEHRGDDVTHEIISNASTQTFIMPLDRQDIHGSPPGSTTCSIRSRRIAGRIVIFKLTRKCSPEAILARRCPARTCGAGDREGRRRVSRSFKPT